MKKKTALLKYLKI